MAQPGPVNAAGDEIGVTVPYTDWSWPAPVASMEWDFEVEREPRSDGYFWAYQFSFANGASGFVGLQSRGGFQPNPPDGPVTITSMMVFWIGNSPLQAELGDIAYPDARKYLQFQREQEWWTIHARYDFKTCRIYHLRVGRNSTDADGNPWYGAWIVDKVTEEETYIGRILVPTTWGSLVSSSAWTTRIGYEIVTSCRQPESVSALFFNPTGPSPTSGPTSRSNRVDAKCADARFTEFADAVRQEVGVSP